MGAGGVPPFISDGSASSHLIHIQKFNIHFFSEQTEFSLTDLFKVQMCWMSDGRGHADGVDNAAPALLEAAQ